MNREALELAKTAIAEGWDAFKIMADFCAFQREQDAKILEQQGHPELAELIRIQ